MRKRVLKFENSLRGLIEVNEPYRIAISFDEASTVANLADYGLNMFVEGQSVLPAQQGPTSKRNVNGMYVRKQPEQKISKLVHIRYYKKPTNLKVEFDRFFNVYAKELLHQYKIQLTFITNHHGQRLIVSPELNFDDTRESNMLANHIANIFLEIFGTYEICKQDFEYAVLFNKQYDLEILPKGNFETKDIDDVIRQASLILKDEEAVKAYHGRLKLIQRFNPSLRGKGPKEMYGYLVFGFAELGIAVVESMYFGNATYVFDLDSLDSVIAMNKQDILKNKLYKKRLVHNETWVDRMIELLTPIKKVA